MSNDLSMQGCSLELCQCDKYAEVLKNFKPLYFGSYNTDYELPMYRADGTLCGCDEYSFAGMYGKLPHGGDLGPFSKALHVKLPPHRVIQVSGIKEETILKPYESYSSGVLGYFTHEKLCLEHHRLNKVYKPPPAVQLCPESSDKPTNASKA